MIIYVHETTKQKKASKGPKDQKVSYELMFHEMYSVESTEINIFIISCIV